MAKNKFVNHSKKVIKSLDSVVEDALKEIGLFVEGEAKLRSPVDTGRLRDSIDNKVVSDKRVDIGTNVEYAIYVEKGTSRQSAQAFLTPAVEENIAEIEQIIKEKLRKHMNKGGGR